MFSLYIEPGLSLLSTIQCTLVVETWSTSSSKTRQFYNKKQLKLTMNNSDIRFLCPACDCLFHFDFEGEILEHLFIKHDTLLISSTSGNRKCHLCTTEPTFQSFRLFRTHLWWNHKVLVLRRPETLTELSKVKNQQRGNNQNEPFKSGLPLKVHVLRTGS